MPSLAIYKLIISENQQIYLKKLPLHSESASLNAASRTLPNGVYTTFRTYEGNKLLPLEHHIERLETSAALLGNTIQLNGKVIYDAIRKAVQGFQPSDTRIRLTVGIETSPGNIFISIEPLKSPTQIDYERGVSAITVPLYREIPEAKQTSFISTAEQIRQQLPADAHEGLLLDEQENILEGLSSNFFYIRNQVLWTAPRGILSGITRSLVLKAASSQGIPVIFEAAKITEISTFEEAFLTSSTRSILPVVNIDNYIVGDGRIGNLTKVLSRAYWDEIKEQLVVL